MADKLQKSEAIIDKYKKRFEEVGDLRRQLRVCAIFSISSCGSAET